MCTSYYDVYDAPMGWIVMHESCIPCLSYHGRDFGCANVEQNPNFCDPVIIIFSPK